MNPASLIGHVLELLELIDHTTQPADRLSTDFFRSRTYLGSHDRRFIADTVFGIVRHRRFAEALVEQYLAEHPGDADLNLPHDRYLSVLTAFSVICPVIDPRSNTKLLIPPLLWKTSFPKIDLQCFLDGLHSLAGLGFLNEEDDSVRLGVRYSFQDWMVDEWKHHYCEQTEAILNAFNTPAPISLRVNTKKASRDDCRIRLQQEGIETDCSAISPVGLVAQKRFNASSSPTFKDGWFEMQDEGSQIISLIANPISGDIVIDGCAGAGGKTLHLSDMMKNEGEIIAIDVDAKRLKELEQRALRAGTSIVRPILRDALIPENFYSKADLVLVDAPCSGSGTLRRNPAFKWTITESLVDHYAELQQTLLQFNAQFVKPGGKLVYGTCSLFKKENEDVVGTFLKEHPGFHFERQNGIVESDQDSVTLFPHMHNTDGFFITVMRREI